MTAPANVEAYGAKLLTRAGREIAAGCEPLFDFNLGAKPTRVRLLEIATDQGLTLQMEDQPGKPKMQFGWSKVTVVDRRALALALRRDTDAESNEIAGFFALLANDARAADECLRQAGDRAATVRALFIPVK